MNRKKIVVLGSGMVGKVIAQDLSDRFEVTSVDRSEEQLLKSFKGSPVKTIVADLSQPSVVRELVGSFDFVVGALPGFMGYRALEAVIFAGKNCVDISFFPEDPFTLADQAKSQGVCALVDMGVAPGMSNAIMGKYFSEMHQVESFSCVVGGLPVERIWPHEYRAPFSPMDVIEEYTRSARYIENGMDVVVPALTGIEKINFGGIGTLESFNTDGLRTLASTCRVSQMKEKTLRYPGHAEMMLSLRESGFFSKEERVVAGQKVRPIDVSSSLLFEKWRLGDEEPEFTVMRVEVVGQRHAGGPQEKIVYDLLDRYDPVLKRSSMSRTTGYACTAAVTQMILGGFDKPGVWAPEQFCFEAGVFEDLLAYQSARGVNYIVSSTLRPEARQIS